MTRQLLCLVLFSVVLELGCQSGTQKSRAQNAGPSQALREQQVVELIEQQIHSAVLARTKYANDYRRYLRDGSPDAVFEVQLRSTKNQYINGDLSDILILRCEMNNCIKARDAFIRTSYQTKLAELGFHYFLVGSLKHGRFTAYDVTKQQWMPKELEFCSPAESCTLVETKQVDR
jgi:hypothetical protein